MEQQHSPPLQITAPPEQPLLPKSPSKDPPPRRHRIWIWIWILVLVLAGAGGYYYWSKRKPAASSTTGKGGQGQGPNAQAAPVEAAKARKGNIGVYVTGLGAVTPIYTVTVQSRVDGQLMQLFYKEGDMVHQGDKLAEIDPRPYQAMLTQYEGQLIRDQALLDNAKIDQARYETLLKQNAIPEQQLATQVALVKQDEGNVKNDQGLIDSAKVNLVYCNITAPITGRVGLRLVDPGNIVQTTDSTGLVVITQLQPISVIFTIAEDQLPPVLTKHLAGTTLPVDAFDREMKKKLASGSLTTIDNLIDQTTGTVKLRATFDNQHNELFPNQFVNARLLQQEKRGVVLVPSAAVQRNSQSTYVYVVKPDSTVTLRQVKVGTSDDNDTEITSGVEEGDVVVLTGVDKLQENSKVTVHLDAPASNGKQPAVKQPAVKQPAVKQPAGKKPAGKQAQ